METANKQENELYDRRRENILSFVKDKDYKPMRAKHIAEFMQVPQEDRDTFYNMIEELVQSGDIIITKKGKINDPSRDNIYKGVFKGNRKGFGFVACEKFEEEIFIPASSVNGAIHKDKVLFRITGSDSRGLEGEIISLLERGLKHIVCTYEQVKNYGFAMPDDNKICDDIYIPSGKSKGAVTGHKVLVKITKPADKNSSPEGVVTKILGHINDPGVDILSIIYQHDLPLDFSDEVYRETESISDTVTAEDMIGREDMRNIDMVTIDGEDAKDLDDAVSVEALDNGNYRLGVYIADVSYYVREGSAINKEAYKRGTSVYLTDRVIPMLPHKLSNGICSLNEGLDRLSLCCLMEIDEKGNVISHDIKKAVINVNRRMSYNIVYDILTNDHSEYIDEYRELIPMFRNMESLRNILKTKREKRGAVEFNSDEVKIILDETGRPIDIVKRDRNVATSIIEEFMLIANETVAEHFFWLDIPFVYRIHEVPDEEKFEKLQEFIGAFGYVIKGSSKHPKSYQQLLKNVENSPEEMLINKMALRSMKQAQYSSENDKHFGLAAQYYCHFTSPIRRYPDLQIHRIISEYTEGKLTEKRMQHYNNMLAQVSKHCSERERCAEETERETDKYKIAEYMESRIGQVYDGIISGVTSWGIYVELPNTVEGMVSVKDLVDDYYEFDKDRLRYFGVNFHKTYTLGDSVKVLLTRASKETGTIDFEFAE